MANLIVRSVTYDADARKVKVEGSAPTTVTVRVLVNPRGLGSMTPRQIFNNYAAIEADGKGEKPNAGDFIITIEVGGTEPYQAVTVTADSKRDDHNATPSDRVNQMATRPGVG
jgi:hypothetical protein